MKFWVVVGLFIASVWLGFYVTPFLYGFGIIGIPYIFADNIAKMATKQTIVTHNTTKSKPIVPISIEKHRNGSIPTFPQNMD